MRHATRAPRRHGPTLARHFVVLEWPCEQTAQLAAIRHCTHGIPTARTVFLTHGIPLCTHAHRTPAISAPLRITSRIRPVQFCESQLRPLRTQPPTRSPKPRPPLPLAGPTRSDQLARAATQPRIARAATSPRIARPRLICSPHRPLSRSIRLHRRLHRRPHRRLHRRLLHRHHRRPPPALHPPAAEFSPDSAACERHVP